MIQSVIPYLLKWYYRVPNGAGVTKIREMWVQNTVTEKKLKVTNENNSQTWNKSMVADNGIKYEELHNYQGN